MTAAVQLVQRVYWAFLLIGGVLWALDVPLRLGVSLIEAEWLGPYLGVGVAAGLLSKPYGARAGRLDLVLGLAAILGWSWMAYNFDFWLLDFAGNTPEKYLPGIVAIVLMMEALRKICGLPITILVWVLILYAFVGFVLPRPFQAERAAPEAVVMYLYADTNAIPGLVLVIVAGLVLAFVVLGRLMEVSGATAFFTNLAMSVMGHRKGGPAKVAILASSLFGSISGSPVGNIMSTGVVTIPLMKRTGFRAHQAAAIEAVASTGGQIAPPVMGAAAFVMAEFLLIDYYEVVLAALLPAILYYACLFVQVNAIAEREGLAGLDRSELPRLFAVLARGWFFVLPLVLLIYLLFWEGASPATAALTAAAVLLVFALIQGRMRTAREWGALVFGGGESMVPLVLIGGAASAVVGVMAFTGFGQQLSFLLVQAGEMWGLLPMLILTAMLSIILGMGMPTTAIYVVLATVIAPALVRMGVTEIAAHLFIFYFGVMSFLTPPVAVSSFVAAGLAGAGMWRTGGAAMRLSAIAFLLPFLWAYDPALLLEGSVLAVAVVLATTLAAIFLIAIGLHLMWRADAAGLDGLLAGLIGIGVAAAVLAVGTAPIWLGGESPLALGLGLAVIAGCTLSRRIGPLAGAESSRLK